MVSIGCAHCWGPSFALEAAFDYSNRAPLILVAALCTPAEIRAAGIKGVDGSPPSGLVSMGVVGGWFPSAFETPRV